MFSVFVPSDFALKKVDPAGLGSLPEAAVWIDLVAPTVQELAKRIDVEEDAVIEALDVARAYSGVPLDILTPPGEAAPEHPKLGFTDEAFEQVQQRELLRGVIAQLPELEREVLLLRFMANKTQTEIAGIVGVSQMQVSRLVARGLKKLRSSLGVEEPPAG